MRYDVPENHYSGYNSVVSDTIDLAAYADRIGVTGPLAPTLETLTAILHGHTCSIPFENLNVLQHKPILLDNASLQQKLIEEKRGGYCFEQNGLLLAVLQQIGFDARPIAARVRLNSPTRDITPPRTHLVVIVNLENQEWVADVGVGPMSLTAPILLNTQEEQPTPHGTRRIQKEDDKLYHQTLTADGWVDVWESRLEPMPLIDRQVASWYTSTNPTSNFAQMLVCTMARPEGERIMLLNHTFTRRKHAETLETRHLETKAELLQTLQAEFNITLPQDVNLGPPNSAWPTE